ncbi:hypothetical protein SAMN05216223_105247 [Actinacidiphila yanglinensis]|uniref:Uncharacterized protein n=1 Tax=Actinacidiphila yanglinensis TaxID=310779 RepID=A0A1H6A8M3_9ACTN|nr:DUF6344 domain-containing protein [Actinacidiphila yanglinensis]SEG45103.1 hypothetical protein SAMN05216223_105247 [Actinacidiphila yanglinensis]
MAADIKTFWGALLSVLLKCIAALGFAPADRAAARHQAVATGAGATTTVEPAAQVAVASGAEAAATRVSSVPAPVGPPAQPSRRGAGARIPAPRAAESRLVRRSRGRTLPPTMKQRIGAEAHGTSPSARSLRTGDAPDESGDLGALTAATGAPATSGASADVDRTAPQHREYGPKRARTARATRERFTRAA